ERDPEDAHRAASLRLNRERDLRSDHRGSRSLTRAGASERLPSELDRNARVVRSRGSMATDDEDASRPRPFLARAALVALAAGLSRLALPPFGAPELALVALAPFLLALRGLTPREGLRAGFLFGLVSAALDAHWFLNVFPLPLAFALWLVLALFF